MNRHAAASQKAPRKRRKLVLDQSVSMPIATAALMAVGGLVFASNILLDIGRDASFFPVRMALDLMSVFGVVSMGAALVEIFGTEKTNEFRDPKTGRTGRFMKRVKRDPFGRTVAADSLERTVMMPLVMWDATVEARAQEEVVSEERLRELEPVRPTAD